MKLLLKVTSVVLCLLLFNTCEILSKPLEKRLTLVNQIIDLIKRENVKLSYQKDKKGLPSTPLGK